MPTPQEHRALLLEILTEMTPEQLDEALQPLNLDESLDFESRPGKNPKPHTLRVRNPYYLSPDSLLIYNA